MVFLVKHLKATVLYLYRKTQDVEKMATKMCKYTRAIECHEATISTSECLGCLSVFLLKRYHQIVETLKKDNPSLPYKTSLILQKEDQTITEIETALYTLGKVEEIKKLSKAETPKP